MLSRFNQTPMGRRLGIGAYLLAALLGAVGQLLFKVAARDMGTFSSTTLALCPYYWAAAFAYFGVMALFLVGLRLHGEVSVLYPVYATTFVFGLVFSRVVLNETATPGAAAGTLLIGLGIALMNRKKEIS